MKNYENFDEEPQCDNSGVCTAPKGATGIASCIHCGKELYQKNGQWFTWDAENFSNPKPQYSDG